MPRITPRSAGARRNDPPPPKPVEPVYGGEKHARAHALFHRFSGPRTQRIGATQRYVARESQGKTEKDQAHPNETMRSLAAESQQKVKPVPHAHQQKPKRDIIGSAKERYAVEATLPGIKIPVIGVGARLVAKPKSMREGTACPHCGKKLNRLDVLADFEQPEPEHHEGGG